MQSKGNDLYNNDFIGVNASIICVSPSVYYFDRYIKTLFDRINLSAPSKDDVNNS